MNTAANTADDSRLPSVTIGVFRSCRKGEILLIYLNDGQTNAAILPYDQLSRQERRLVQVSAQDPLSVLKRTAAGRQASRRAT
jgi:hypothetical protein